MQPLIPDRPFSLTSKLSLTLCLVLALVCLFGFQASNTIDQQPPSFASQLLNSVAANSAYFSKGFKNVSAHGGDRLFDNGPHVAALSARDWFFLAIATASKTQWLPLAAPLNNHSLQQPQPRAPPVV